MKKTFPSVQQLGLQVASFLFEDEDIVIAKERHHLAVPRQSYVPREGYAREVSLVSQSVSCGPRFEEVALPKSSRRAVWCVLFLTLMVAGRPVAGSIPRKRMMLSTIRSKMLDLINGSHRPIHTSRAPFEPSFVVVAPTGLFPSAPSCCYAHDHRIS